MSIYQLERDEDVDELCRLLAESDSPAVRRRAAVALGEITDPDDRIVADLVGVARDDPERSVRSGAIDALDEIGEVALRRLFVSRDGSTDEAAAEPPIETYVASLDHEMPAMRMAAAAAIASVEARDAVGELIGRLADPHPRVRTRIVRALGRLGDERAVDPLARSGSGAPAGLRGEIAAALGEIGGRALEPLFELVEDDDPAVRRRAVLALGRFGSEHAVGRLVDRLGDDAESVRRAAVFSIVESLSNAPSGASHELRQTIVEALNTTHGEVVTESLVELFEGSAEAHQRRNAAWLLGRVSADRAVAVETLVAALGDDDETVRRFAATSLAAMDADVAEDALLEALEDSNGEHRAMVVYTLGTVGSERSRQRLVELLDETEDLDHQERILSALSKLGGTGSEPSGPEGVGER